MGASLPSGLIIDTERTGWTESCHGGSPLVGGWAPGLRNAAILGGCCTRPLVGLGGLGGRGGRPGACPLRRASASCRRSPLLLRWWDSVTTRMRLQTQTTGMGAPRARKGIRTCELPRGAGGAGSPPPSPPRVVSSPPLPTSWDDARLPRVGAAKRCGWVAQARGRPERHARRGGRARSDLRGPLRTFVRVLVRQSGVGVTGARP